MSQDLRQHSPSSERNQGPILAQLQRLLPTQGLALEIASGTGQHAAHFAGALPGWTWQPSDGDAGSLDSINAWCAGLPNARPALHLDVLLTTWQGAPQNAGAVFNANMLHISPWETCAALMQGAARHLSPQGLLILYGPYIVDGEPTAPSNLAFDASLRARNPAWGLRRLSDVQEQAQAAGLHLHEQVNMPANNLLLVFRRD